MLLIGVNLAMGGLLILAGLAVINLIRADTGDEVIFVQGTTSTPEVEFRAPCGNRSFVEGELTEGRLPFPCPRGVDVTAWQPQAIEVVARVPITTTKAKLYFGGYTALLLAALWGILTSIRRFARATANRRVFIAENARHLARIGMLLLALPLLTTIGEALFETAFPDSVTGIQGFRVQIGLQDNWLLLVLSGLVILAVSSSFRYGVELQEFEKAVV